MTEVFSQLKWKLGKMADLKRAGKKVNDPQVAEFDQQNMELLASGKSSMRNIIDTVEHLKRKG